MTLPESSSGSSVVGETPAVEEWGNGKQEGGEGWGEVSTWGGGGDGGNQQDWDRLWVEVTNEVYQAELVRWVEDREECEQMAVEMDKCKVGNDEAKVVVNDKNKVDDLCGQNDKKNEKWHKQKIVSGLGEMLKQLKGECEECEEDEESESTAVIETDPAVVKEDVKEN